MTGKCHAATDTTDATGTTDNYRDDAALSARQSIYRWQQPRHDLVAAVLAELAGLPSGAVVLDVGCGNGRYLAALREQRPAFTTIGIDCSPGVMADVGNPRVVADARRLPFEDGSCDAVLLLHMLYHVDPPAAALGEAHRVLRSGGVVVVSTNARDDKRRLYDLGMTHRANESFVLEDLPQALDGFADVRVVELPATLRVEDPADVVAFVSSWTHDCDLSALRAEVAAEVAANGSWDAECLVGYAIGRRRRPGEEQRKRPERLERRDRQDRAGATHGRAGPEE